MNDHDFELLDAHQLDHVSGGESDDSGYGVARGATAGASIGAALGRAFRSIHETIS